MKKIDETFLVSLIWISMVVWAWLLLRQIVDEGSVGLSGVVPVGYGALISFFLAMYLSSLLYPRLGELVRQSTMLRHQVECWRYWNLAMGLMFLTIGYVGFRYAMIFFAMTIAVLIWSLIRGVRDWRGA